MQSPNQFARAAGSKDLAASASCDAAEFAAAALRSQSARSDRSTVPRPCGLTGISGTAWGSRESSANGVLMGPPPGDEPVLGPDSSIRLVRRGVIVMGAAELWTNSRHVRSRGSWIHPTQGLKAGMRSEASADNSRTVLKPGAIANMASANLWTPPRELQVRDLASTGTR